MEFVFKDRRFLNNHEITKRHNLKEYIYPNINTDFELYGMHIRTVKETWVYPEHEHAKYEINLVTEGCQIFDVNGVQYNQNKGDIIFVRPGEVHSSSGKKEEGEFTYFCLHFFIDDKLFLPYINSINTFFYSNSSFSRRIRPYLDQLIGTCKTAELTLIEKMKVHSILFELLGVLADILTKQNITVERPTDKASKLAYKIADRIDKIVKQPVHENESILRIEDIASELCISVSYCNKVFKRVYNMSPRQYLSFKKLNESKNLLAQKEYSIEQVAEIVGYYDIAHFSRQFKRWTGLTPSQYRKSNILKAFKS